MELHENRDPSRVREMFAGIAGRYDLLNHVLSLNQDRRWRRRTVRELPVGPGLRVLDLCGGTGDLAVEALRSGRAGVVVCVDFCLPMLRRAERKLRRLGWDGAGRVLAADALRLPFADRSFDAVLVGFGVRNFSDLGAGLREIFRVLRPGGHLAVLEFTRPPGKILSALYTFYLHRILPGIGDGVAGRRGPYGYLARTIAGFPEPPLLAGRIREAGFAGVAWTLLSRGIVAIHTAVRSPRG